MRQPRTRFALLALAAVLALGALAMSVVTAPTALRLLVASELDALGISHEGLETMRLRPLQGSILVGPVLLGVGDAPTARVEQIEADIGLVALLDRRVHIRTLVITGATLQAAAGSRRGVVDVNNFPLDPGDLLTARASLRGKGDLSGWQFEIDTLRVLDSHVDLEMDGDRELDLEIQALTIGNLLRGAGPASSPVEVDATVNDAHFRATGEARTIDGAPSLLLDTELTQVTADGLLRSLGPGDATRLGGTLAARGRHRLSLVPSGGVTGHSEVTVTLHDAAFAMEGVRSLSAKALTAEVAADFVLPEWDRWQLEGQLKLEVDDYAYERVGLARITFHSGRLALSELEWTQDAKGEVRLAFGSDLSLDEAAVSGRVRLSVAMAVNALRAIRFLASGFAARTVAEGLSGWSDSQVTLPRSDLELASVVSANGRFEFRETAEAAHVALSGLTEVTGVVARSDSETTELATVGLDLESLEVESSEAADRLTVRLAARGERLKGTRVGGDVSIASLSATVDPGELTITPAQITGSISGHGEGTGFSAVLSTPAGEASAMLEVERTSIDFASSSFDLNEGIAHWGLSGSGEALGLTASVGDPPIARMQVAGARAQDVRVGDNARIEVGVVSFEGTDIAVRRSALAVAWAAEAPPPGEARPATTEPVRAPLPADETARVEMAQRLLTRTGHDPGRVDGVVGAQTVAAVRAFQAAAGVAVDGLISTELLEALHDVQPQEEESRLELHVTAVEVTGGGRLNFVDDVVDPNVDVSTDFETLEIRNLDTADPDAKVDISATATVNEFSRIELAGWITPLRTPPDFDLQVHVERLALPVFSPYAEAVAGVHIERGELTTTVVGNNQQGRVTGTVELELGGLDVAPISEEHAQRITQAIGVRVGTALDLLENADGRIVLTIPVTGTVDAPKLDVSDVVEQGQSGFFASLFPPTWIAKALGHVAEMGDEDVEPLPFRPGSGALDAAGRAYLEELAARFGDDPDLRFALCGRAVAADARKLGALGLDPSELDAQLDGLAVERVGATRAYVVQTLGIAAERVEECRAIYDARDTGPPRVEFRP